MSRKTRRASQKERIVALEQQVKELQEHLKYMQGRMMHMEETYKAVLYVLNFDPTIDIEYHKGEKQE